MTISTANAAVELVEHGHVSLPGWWPDRTAAWSEVVAVVSATDSDAADLTPIAEYTMPTADAPGRDFQPLHFDFGLPLGLAEDVDVGRFTALHVDAGAGGSGAATRLVRLTDLAGIRRWPSVDELLERLRHRRDDPDVAEGILARVVEVADGSTHLPAKTDPGFLCGLEFRSLEAEVTFLSDHGIDLGSIESRVVIPPGGVLIFDNQACAHGRIGRRYVGELHQLCLGRRSQPIMDQLAVLRRALTTMTVADRAPSPRP